MRLRDAVPLHPLGFHGALFNAAFQLPDDMQVCFSLVVFQKSTLPIIAVIRVYGQPATEAGGVQTGSCGVYRV